MTTAEVLEPAPVRRPLFVSLDTAAKLAAVSRRTIERHVKAGELSVRRLGRRVLIRPDDLAELIERRNGGS